MCACVCVCMWGGGGGLFVGGDYFKYFCFKRGDYSREAINRVAANIQVNTVYNFVSSRRNRFSQRNLTVELITQNTKFI